MSVEEALELKNKGNKAFQEGKFDESIEFFSDAIAINPNDHVYYSNRSGAYASKKDYQKAFEDSAKCVEIKPDWAKGYQRKGLAEFYLDKYDEAIETYNVGLKLDPNNAALKEGLSRATSEKKASNDPMRGMFGG